MRHVRARHTVAVSAKSADVYHLVAFADVACPTHRRIEAEPPAEPLDDVAKDSRILFSRVRIVGRHHASRAQVRDPDVRAWQPKRGSRPRLLDIRGIAADDEV